MYPQVKKLYFLPILAGISGTLFTGSVHAGGYVISNVQEPYSPTVGSQVENVFTWTGPYAGLSAGSAKTKSKALAERDLSLYDLAKETQAAGSCDNVPEGLIGVWGKEEGQWFSLNCQSLWEQFWSNPSWDIDSDPGMRDVAIQGYTSEVITKQSHSTYGVFAGYRHQWSNNFVGGVEASYIDSNSYDSARLMGQAGYALGRVLPYLTVGYDFEEKGAAYGVGVDTALTDHWVGGIAYTKAKDTDRIEARIGWKF